jgi:hypothetical protein
MKDLDITDLGSISTGDLILLSMRLRQVPLLQRLTFTLHVDDQETVAFHRYERFSPQMVLPQFPNLKTLHFRFNDGSRVRRVYNCHSLREAFKAYDHSEVITFASGLETFDGPPDWWTPALA